MSQRGKHRASLGATNKWVVGCLSAVGAVALLVVIGIIVVMMQWRSWAADAVNQSVAREIERSDLPNDQKQRMVGRVERLTEGFKSGEVTLDDAGRVIEKVGKSPLFATAPLWGVEPAYIAPSQLSDQEKQTARMHFSRYMHGVYEEEIPGHTVRMVIEPIAEPRPDNPNQLRLKPSSEVEPGELAQFVENLKKRADKADIPEKHFEIDYAAELERVIDEALNEEGIPAPSDPPPDGNTDPTNEESSGAAAAANPSPTGE